MPDRSKSVRTPSSRLLDLRSHNNLLCYWRFCRTTTCVRARQCRGDAARCELHWRFLTRMEQHWYLRRIGRFDVTV